MSAPRPVMLVAEDALGAAVLRRLVTDLTSLSPRPPQVEGSNGALFDHMPRFVEAGRRGVPHVVLTDLDRQPCAPSLLAARRTGNTLPGVVVRVAVREVEAWLLADRAALAAYLRVPLAKVHARPEELMEPKEELLRLAAKSADRELRREVLPEPGSLARKGIGYNSTFARFVQTAWRPDRAAVNADSLRRAMRAIEALDRAL